MVVSLLVDIICSEKGKGFQEHSSRKTVNFKAVFKIKEYHSDISKF